MTSELRPFPTSEAFDRAVTGMVASYAPRLFAVVQEYGPLVDACIAGWGLAHENHVDVIGNKNTVYFGGSSPEDMLRYFQGGPNLITARIVWPTIS